MVAEIEKISTPDDFISVPKNIKRDRRAPKKDARDTAKSYGKIGASSDSRDGGFVENSTAK